MVSSTGQTMDQADDDQQGHGADSFEPPEARDALRTLAILAGVLIALVLSVVALDVIYGAEPHANRSPTARARSSVARSVSSVAARCPQAWCRKALPTSSH